MDRERLYEKLDIESPEEFQYYESFEALMEDEEHIEEELIREILAVTDADLLSEHIANFFDAFASNVPDDETELSIIVDTFRNNVLSASSAELTDEDLNQLVNEIYKFRKWYAIDHNATDEIKSEEISVRDARYELAAAKLLGDTVSIDFGRALTSGPDAYSVRLRDILND